MRWSLVAGSEEETGSLDNSLDDSRDDSAIGLQFFVKESSHWNTSFTAGIKINVIAGFFSPRVRYEKSVGVKAEEEGYRTQISSFLTQRQGTESGLQYEFSTVFHTRPDTHVDKHVVSVRYRKRTKRDWLYYEIVPRVSFDEECDFKFNPGIRLRVEIFYGGKGAKQFWSRESEDTENFRWYRGVKRWTQHGRAFQLV